LDVFAKLFEDGLERRLEVQAFPRGEIGGYDDVLDFLVALVGGFNRRLREAVTIHLSATVED